jgi:hypothetical protein
LAGRAGQGIGASHAGEGMESMRVAGGIADSVQLSRDLWQWPSQNACRATRWQEAWTDLIEPWQHVGDHLAAGNEGRPARGMVAGPVAVGLGVAVGTRGKRQNAQTVRRVSGQDRHWDSRGIGLRLGGTGQLGSGLGRRGSQKGCRYRTRKRRANSNLAVAAAAAAAAAVAAASTLASAELGERIPAGERPLTADGRSSVATRVARLKTCR